jgi:predicted HNH restriction endonuclease
MFNRKKWMKKYNKKYRETHKQALKEYKRLYYQKTKKHWIEKAREYRKTDFYKDNEKFWRLKYRYNLSRKRYLELIKNGCIICGINDIVDVHHIDGNWHNNKKLNLICLCSKCHTLLHKRIELNSPEKLMDYFIN